MVEKRVKYNTEVKIYWKKIKVWMSLDFKEICDLNKKLWTGDVWDDI